MLFGPGCVSSDREGGGSVRGPGSGSGRVSGVCVGGINKPPPCCIIGYRVCYGGYMEQPKYIERPVQDLKGGDFLSGGNEIFDCYPSSHGWFAVKVYTRTGFHTFYWKVDEPVRLLNPRFQFATTTKEQA